MRLGYSRHGTPAAGIAGRMLVLAAAVLLGTTAYAVNPANTTTVTGTQGFEVGITDVSQPTDPYIIGSGPVLVDSSAVLGAPPPLPINLIYVVDLSGSMEQSFVNPFQDLFPPAGIGPEDDCNGDGVQGSAMDSACFGLISLNQSLGSAVNVDIGMVGFGLGSVIADIQPAAGPQDFTSPPDADDDTNGIADVEEVIASMETDGSSLVDTGFFLFDQNTINGMNDGTNYEDALNAAFAMIGLQPAGETNIVAFLSDGNPNAGNFNNALAALPPDTIVDTFALGSAVANGCDPGNPLEVIASVSGGTCHLVPDPSTLSTVLPEALTTQITQLELLVNGNPADIVFGPNPVSLSLTDVDISGLVMAGTNLIEATGTAADGTVLTADVTLEAILIISVDVDIKPGSFPNSINLGSRGSVPVAILGSASFDVTTINAETVEVAGSPVLTKGKNNKLMASIEDVNGDGYPDLVVHVATSALELTSADTEALVTGELMDGTPIEGSDSVRIVPPH